MKQSFIPKKIHYCWFGGNPLPEMAIKCIESWKKFLPDYEIIEWNESNYDVHKIPYISQAYNAKKYAFVSDFARFDILYEHGGLYFDTDVEVIKSMDKIIEQGAFAGVEFPGKLASGLGLASPEASPIYKEILDSYKKSSFIKENGQNDLTTVVTRVSDIFKKYGFTDENKIQKIADVTIYPVEYFCPKDYETGEINITENTYSIHHYDASWVSDFWKNANLIRNKIYKKTKNVFFRNFIFNIAVRIYAIKYYGFMKILKYIFLRKKGQCQLFL